MAEMQTRIDDLLEIKASKNADLITMTLEQERAKERFAELSAGMNDLKSQYDRQIVANEDLEQEAKTLKFRLAKVEDQRRQLQNDMKSAEETMDNLRQQLRHSEEALAKYEQEGAAYQPMYQRASSENAELKVRLEEQEAQMKLMSLRVPTADVEVQTDAIQETQSPGSASKKGKRQRTGKRASDEKASVRTAQSTFVISPADSEMGFTHMESLPVLRENPAVAAPDVPMSPSEEELAQRAPAAPAEPLAGWPSDYRIPHTEFEASPTMVDCIYRLLPVSLDQGAGQAHIGALNPISKSQAKNYNWLLSHIVDFFAAIRSWNDLSPTCDSRQLFKTYLTSKAKMEVLANKMFVEVTNSASYYAQMSTCVDFFQQFMMNEFSVVDFKFFNMIFNVAFQYLYPGIESIVMDADLTPQSTQFLIHIDVAMAIVDIVFHYRERTITLEELRQATKVTPHPDLIDFFAFSSKLVTVFRQARQQFHKEVANILTLVGWDKTQSVSEFIFRQFFVLVNPIAPQEELDKLWSTFSLQEASRDRDDRDGSQGSFISFCAAFPDLANTILALPCLHNFEHSYTSLPTPIERLIVYVERRLTQFLRSVLEIVPVSLKKRVEKLVVRVRDALLLCDASTTLQAYRLCLQFLDLQMMRETPFLVVRPDLSAEDADEVIARLTARETLVCSWFDRDVLREKMKRRGNAP
jgi:hypothetical protein